MYSFWSIEEKNWREVELPAHVYTLMNVGEAAHLAGALIFPIGDFIHQLVREDISNVQLAAVFKQGSERVRDE